MVYGHRITRIRLRCLAIGAALIVCFQQLLAEFRRKVGAHVALQLVGGRDRMTAPAQQRGCMGFPQHQTIGFGMQLRQFSAFGFR